VHHVSINVSDVERSVVFYVDVLGGKIRHDRPELGFDGAWLDFGDQQVHLLEGAPPPAVGQHFALAVSDLDAAVASLRARGIEITDAVAIGAGRQSFLSDPDGNAVELHQPGR
jgi:catechol 2,3-dioxygenase-like lactoylglutathione lyase family enzyme